MIKLLTKQPFWTLLLANIFVPIALVGIFKFVNLPPGIQSSLAYGFVALCLITNLVIVLRAPNYRRVGIGITILNVITFVAMGAISFVTAIPNIPGMFNL